MIYSARTKLAMTIAYQAHHGQYDKSGLPYIFHPLHLAEQLSDEVAICVALLHDVAEDTAMTLADLHEMGVQTEVIEALALLKHENELPYLEYIKKIKDSGNKAAIEVKIADLHHNSDLSRLARPDDKTLKKWEVYQKALALLQS